MPVAIFLLMGMAFSSPKVVQENNSPTVKLIVSNLNSKGGKEVKYVIEVADREDGDSRYDEISGNEVFLHVEYFPDSSEAAQVVKNQDIQKLPKALSLIRTSTCFSCHALSDKLIGPSFDQLSKKYRATEGIVKNLVEKIAKGTSGAWGNIPMPSNTDLKNEELEIIVKWILNETNNPNNFYKVGLKGNFYLSPNKNAGTYVLTASYEDRGLNGRSKKTGQDVIFIRNINR